MVLVLGAEARTGPDIWREARLADGFAFVSRRLKLAFEADCMRLMQSEGVEIAG